MALDPPQPSLAEQPGPSIGVDEWVARQATRREYPPGLRGELQRRLERVGWWPRLAIAAALGALIPQLGLTQFQLQIGINALILATLAVGLNVAVGWAGLLDLGYIAFYGFGAYGFALLSSNQLDQPHGIHLPAYASIPAIMVAAAILGLLVGLPSRRLIGDYLAIVTLFFGEAFATFVNVVAPSKLGGANGIFAIDPIRGFGSAITSNQGYFYLMLILLVATIAVLHLLDTSRTGRAWRAVREDPLAASMMTVPVNRVKLMAFAFGAMVAAMTGTVFATDFDTSFLILIYAALILGGAGSIAGAVLGGLLVEIVLDGVLRSPTQAGYVFYGLILLTMVVRLRPWRRLAGVLAAIVAFGFAVHAIVSAISASAVAGGPQSSGWIHSALKDWVVVPLNHAGNIPAGYGNVGFAVLICLLIALTRLRDWWRTALLVPTVYLAACVWESRLIVEPSITRLILLGAILIVVMNARPQGLLGARRVEIV